jgi:hypothetical protein
MRACGNQRANARRIKSITPSRLTLRDKSLVWGRNNSDFADSRSLKLASLAYTTCANSWRFSFMETSSRAFPASLPELSGAFRQFFVYVDMPVIAIIHFSWNLSPN